MEDKVGAGYGKQAACAVGAFAGNDCKQGTGRKWRDK